MIILTKRQHELLYMDTYCEYPETNNPAPELAPLRGFLDTGRKIPVTPMLIEHVTELADRDQDPIEQRVYKNLLRKITSPSK